MKHYIDESINNILAQYLYQNLVQAKKKNKQIQKRIFSKSHTFNLINSFFPQASI